MRELIIVVPLPPRELFPNYPADHWTGKAKAVASYGYTVKLLALNERHLWETANKQIWEPLVHASIALEFTWPASKRGPLPDEKNLEAAFKSGIDALTARVRGVDKRGDPIVGAGIIADDSPGKLAWLPTVPKRGSEAGVQITIKEIRRSDVQN